MAGPVNLISAAALPFDGASGDGASSGVTWDQSGRFAIFRSTAPDLVNGQNTGDGDGPPNLFLHDRLVGTRKLVNHVPGNPTAAGEAGVFAYGMSADGKWVVYGSLATNLVDGQVDINNNGDVFLWNRESDTTSLVSRAAGTTTTAADSLSVLGVRGISADGRYVSFRSQARNLVSGQVANGFSQCFLFDRQSGLTVMVSHAFNLAARSGNGSSTRPSLSADGRWVAFSSQATNLLAGLSDSNEGLDVFLWDRDASFEGSSRLVSRREGFPATTGNAASDNPSISADGTGLAFLSGATDLEGVSDDFNGQALDAFHYDRPTDTLRLVSHAFRAFGSPRETADGIVFRPPSISDDGDAVAFVSNSTNHVSQQVNASGVSNVFLWKRSGLARGITLASHVAGNASASHRTTANGFSDSGIIAGDGSGVAFSSRATDLVAGVTDLNDLASDVFFFRRDSGAVSLVGHTPDGLATGLFASTVDSVALGGTLIGFTTSSSNLVVDDLNAASDVFFHGSPLLLPFVSPPSR
jgi:Tol biopolymer transport system component